MPKNKKVSSDSDSDSGPEDRNPPSKKSKGASDDSKKGVSDDSKKGSSASEKNGEKEWVLEKMRLVRINEFRGRKTVDIREHYEKNGEVLPGRKGIALSALQWRKLLEHADEITKALD